MHALKFSYSNTDIFLDILKIISLLFLTANFTCQFFEFGHFMNST